MAVATIKNWGDFQHYKNRCPPWIKLQKSLLDNFEFACLPIASKALAPLLWLLASESMDGSVRVDPEWLAFRLRFTVDDIQAGLTPLFDKGFLVLASSVLAPCLRDACLEGEGEGEGETESRGIKKPAKAKKTPLPENFALSDRVKAWAVEKSHNRLTERLEHFISTAKAKAYEYVDWDEAFMNAVRGNWAKLELAPTTKRRKQLGEGSSTNYGLNS
jgi:hypothetical protein